MEIEGDEVEPEESTSTPKPPSKLRARIMASGYNYKLLNDSQLDYEDEVETQPFTKRPSALRKLVLFLGLVSIALLIALIVVAASNNDDDDDDDDDNKNNDNKALFTGPDGRQICMTATCVETSTSILTKMDLNVDPCQDMYQYACGRWLEEVVPPSDQAKWDMFRVVGDKNNGIIRKLIEAEGILFKGKNSSAIDKLKTFYRTCMDESTIEEQGTTHIKELISKLGSWTVTSEDITEWDRDSWTLQKSLEDMHALLRSSLFGFAVDKDVKNATRTIIYFTQSGLTLAHEDKYKNDALKDAFLAFAVKVGVLLGGKASNVTAKMTEVYNFEKQLAEFFVPKTKLRDPLAMYNKMTIGDLQQLMGSWVDIKNYLSTSFHGRPFNNGDEIVVYVPSYFEKIKPLIEGTDKEILANYMMWNMIQSITGYLPDAFSEAALELSKAESGVTSLSERWKRCLAKTEAVLGFASSALYVEDNFPPESKAKVTRVVNDIQRQFILNLDTLSWLDTATRAGLKDKAEAMTDRVGYPEWILDPVKLDERYDKLQVKEGELLTNKLYAVEYLNNRELEKYGKPPDANEWTEVPDKVNAFYQPFYNYVTLPAGILQPPFFASDFPEPYIYGTIGMIIGHEITHGFDDEGRMFDKYGNLANMWSSAAAEAFDKKSKCIKDQYSAYTLQGEHLNGELTAGENIADNGGVKFAFDAFKSLSAARPEQTALPGLNLTDDQIYFLGFSQIWCSYYKPEYEKLTILTDPHSNNKYRVIGALSNSKEFAKAYSCDLNSPLNPEKKCPVW